MKIAIILGSGRDGRNGEAVANWILEQAQTRETGFEYELVDIKDFDLPFVTNAVIPSYLDKNYDNDVVKAWSATIDGFDGFVFVTPEYNHSVPAQFKNAFDHLYGEWAEKAVAIAGYSYSGGAFTRPAWREIVSVPQMRATETDLSFFIGDEWVDGVFTPAAGQVENVATVLGQLEALLG